MSITIGPDHMRRFIESEGVADAFKGAALNRPLFTKKKGLHCCYLIIVCLLLYLCHTETHKDVSIAPITLRYKNPKSYRNDVLAKIVPRILNPSGLYTSA